MKDSSNNIDEEQDDNIYDEDEDEELVLKTGEMNMDNPAQFPEGGTGGNTSKRNLNKVILHHLKNEKMSSSSPEDSKLNDKNDDLAIGSSSENSKQIESYWPSRINEILQGFDPKELVPKQSMYEKLQLFMLKLKSMLH